MPTLIDLTDPALDIAPIPQSTDAELCELTFDSTIASDDVLKMQVRTLIGEKPVGTLTSKDGNFSINPTTRKVKVIVKDDQTRKWFGREKDPITSVNRVRVLTGTLLHETIADGSRAWSGEIDLKFAIALSFTRG